MPRHQIALALPSPLPPLPTLPHPSPSPLQTAISNTIASTDYDLAVVPLTNHKWQERWERLCLRPVEDDEGDMTQKQLERDMLDREADIWRRDGGLLRDEVNITRLEETQHLIGVASDWLEMDSADEGIRFDSELALRAELAHALYLSMTTLILPAPSLANRAQLPSYARAIANLLQMGGAAAYTQISIRIPISDPSELINQGPAQQLPNHEAPTFLNGNSPISNDKSHKRISSFSTRPTSLHQSMLQPTGMRNPSNASAASGVSAASSTLSAMSSRSVQATAQGDPNSTWEMWDTIRTLCGYHPRLTVTLDLTNPLPPSVGALARWTAEPVKHVYLPGGSFIPNAKGYPVLSKATQAFIRGISKQSPIFILSQTNLNKHPSGGPSAYLQYLRHITSQAGSIPSLMGGSSMGKLSESVGSEFANYFDFLQAPLQPLMDDLGSATYDVFERDPVKYRQYEEAIVLALNDLDPAKKHVLTIAGAGRGPIVACALRALERTKRQASVYAVEKNANAYITLQERKAIEWKDKVGILFGDMRTLEVPQEADILISELLGSFGDNELSPECLDGAMRFMKPEGISIPMSYTAHLAPLSSSKLHADVTSPTRPASAAETPYVVMMSQVNLLSGEGPGPSGRCGERVQQCWQFEHPRRELILDTSGAPLTNSHNTRSSSLLFSIPHAGQCHGLAGYFEAHLYGNIGLSTHPETAHRVSPEMFSWFPLFFPFRHPLYLPSGSELQVDIWRLADGKSKKIWYEWCAEAYLPTVSSTPTSAGIQGGLSPNGTGTPGAGPKTPTLAQPSPMMDAPFSPGIWVGGPVEGRVKIGQTGLHNAGGAHSYVGL